jgi:hypothetical protein
MGNLVDLTGQRVGRLTVLERAESHGNNAYWKCICDCGNSVIVSRPNLKNGQISCGCARDDANRIRSTRHGKAGSKLYMVWVGIKQRTTNPNNRSWEDYGGRGIHMCVEWENNFQTFYDWAIDNGYHEGLAIDRCDNEKGYSPDNCSWITQAENNKNRRKRRYAKKPN